MLFTRSPQGHPQLRALVRKLAPVFEVTPQIRPRLLLAGVTATAELIVFGLLYHTERDAFRSCLRFQIPQQPEFMRCTRWRRWTAHSRLAARYSTIERGFTDVAAQLGTQEVIRLEFAATATDTDILNTVLASPLASLVPDGQV